jgi:hypothetical protein
MYCDGELAAKGKCGTGAGGNAITFYLEIPAIFT